MFVYCSELRFFQAFLFAQYCLLRSTFAATRSFFGFSTASYSSCGDSSCGTWSKRTVTSPLVCTISSRSASRSSLPMCEGSSNSTTAATKCDIVQIRKSTYFCAIRLRAALFSIRGSKNACIETCASTMKCGGGNASTSNAYISRSDGVSAFFTRYFPSITSPFAKVQRPAMQG